MVAIPALGRQKEAGGSQASMVYRANSRTSKATQRTLSQKEELI